MHFNVARVRRLLGLSCVILATTAASLAVARAGNDNEELTTMPFIAAESPQSKDFHAVTTHVGRRNPYFLSTNKTPSRNDSFCGVLLNRGGERGISDFQNFSLSYKGPSSAMAVVQYKMKVGPHVMRNLRLAQGSQGAVDKDGFRQVGFTSQQFGIPAGSSIHDIAIIAPPLPESGSLRVDDMRVNGRAANKILATKFLDLVNVGVPFQSLSFKASQSAAPPTSTQIVLMNLNKKTSCEVWVTIGSPSGASSVGTLFPPASQWANGGAGTSDHMKLPKAKPNGRPNLLVFSDASLSNVNGNVYFGYPASTDPTLTDPRACTPCPSSGPATCSTLYPCGVNLIEWALNPSVATQNESLNLSLVNGMNTLTLVSLNVNGGTSWATNGINVNGTSNVVPVSSNVGRYGVYPYNCTCCDYNPPDINGTVCSATSGCGFVYPWTAATAPPGSPLSSCSSTPSSCSLGSIATVCDTQPICQLARPGGIKGGYVQICFQGFAKDSNPNFCK